MSDKPPIMDLPIETADSGFYSGFSTIVTLLSKVIIGALIIWCVAFPEEAGAVLGKLNGYILASFNFWYMYVVAFFFLTCVILAIVPKWGSLKLGRPEDTIEFSNFSWFSMMFGAGIGIGMLTFATAEPIYHFASSPDTIQGFTEGKTEGNVMAAYKWSYLHWGFSAWACYAVIGMTLAYMSYRRGLPLTIRSTLTPLFGSRLSGTIGHIVDVVAVVATVLGVAQTLGFGVQQFLAGLTRIGFGDWMMSVNADGASEASAAGIGFALLVIMGASTMSALSGVGKGIKWLSNINMGLSFALLTFFLFFGATGFALWALFGGMWEYLKNLPQMMFVVWPGDGVEGSVAEQLRQWQSDWWTVFYWAWWIAFAPFVGVFLARISKGRTIREFVLGAILVPTLMCFIWFAFVGGTAISLELSGEAGGTILGAGQEDQLFATLAVMLSDNIAWIFNVLVVILLLTYLVTSADSAVLIINTINAGGDEGPKARPHIYFWGIALALVVGALLLLGGLGAIKTAMVIGALPFSVVMALMAVSLIKAVIADTARYEKGVETYHSD